MRKASPYTSAKTWGMPSQAVQRVLDNRGSSRPMNAMRALTRHGR